jgi:hypothetical protein
VIYLPWSTFSDNNTHNFGNIVFALVSSRNDVLGPDGFELEASVNQTLDLVVWSWIANRTLSELRMNDDGLDALI